MHGYRVRRPTFDDVRPVVAVIRACEEADSGAAERSEEDVAVAWRLFDLERDVWLVVDADDRPVAAASVRSPQPVQIYAFVPVLPEHRGRGIGTHLAGLVEERARERAQEAPPGSAVKLSQQVGQHNDVAASLLEAHGYSFGRRFWEMEIALDGEPERPRWPEGIRVAPLEPGQDRAVFDAMHEAFRDHWGFVDHPYEDWRAWMVDRETFDPSLWLLAWASEELAGASLCRVRDDGAGWVNVLGVRRPWRRLGLGLALLRHSFHEFRRRGAERAGLDVDSESITGATRLYERAGMRVARHSDAYEKVLR